MPRWGGTSYSHGRSSVCVIQWFIEIGLKPSYEPLAHLRWHTLSPVKMPLWGLEFFNLDRRMCNYKTSARGSYSSLSLSVISTFSKSESDSVDSVASAEMWESVVLCTVFPQILVYQRALAPEKRCGGAVWPQFGAHQRPFDATTCLQKRVHNCWL